MNSVIKRIYYNLPFSLKNIVASIKGYQLKKWRYDSSTLERINKYLERENWSKNDWNEFYLCKLEKKLHIARNHVPFYRAYWEKRKKMGDNVSSNYLENWPILNKKEIIKNGPLFIDERYKIRDLYHDHTSGTTGTPIDIFIDSNSVKEQYALFEARVKRKYDIYLNDKWAIIGAQKVVDVNKKRPPFWVYNFISRQLYFSSLHIADWSIVNYVDALIRYQPKCLIGYTNSIYELALGMRDKGLSFHLKAVITNAEPLYKYQEEVISEAFKCQVVETYGQAELVSFANRFPDGKMYESPEMGFLEVLNFDNNENGVYGQLIATGLLNSAMPLIRYNTDDLISIEKPAKIDGKLPEFGKLLGRNDDVIVLEDGRKIVQIDGIFTKELNIVQGQIIQESLNDFTVKIVPDNIWSDSNKKIIINSLYDRLGIVNIEIEVCDKIQASWAGKFRVIMSKISFDNNV